MISSKPGVTFVYHPAGFRILEAAKCVSNALGRDLTILRGSEGGRAYDFRMQPCGEEMKATILAGLQAELGPQFCVAHEAAGTADEHLHVQPVSGATYAMAEYLRA